MNDNITEAYMVIKRNPRGITEKEVLYCLGCFGFKGYIERDKNGQVSAVRVFRNSELIDVFKSFKDTVKFLKRMVREVT